MMIARSRAVAVFLAIAVIVAGCLSSSPSSTTADEKPTAQPAESTVASLTDSTEVISAADYNAAVDSTAHAATTVGPEGTTIASTPASTAPADAMVANVDLGACTVGQPDIAGEITFIARGALLSTTGVAGATARCIEKLATPPQRVTWNPPGTAALLNSDRVLFSDGSTTPSGFLPANPTVRWSYPTGRNLIGIAANGDLAKRDPRTLNRTVLESGMSRVTEVVYQPAGTSVTAVGDTPQTDDDSVAASGVWAMSNIGRGLTPLVENQTAERVWNLRYDAAGQQLHFLAEHAPSEEYEKRTYHVHRLDRSADLSGIADFLTSTDPLDHLVVSEYATNNVASGSTEWAVRVGVCGNSTITLSVDGTGTTTASITSTSSSLDPVGWLPNGRLVIEQRAKGACDGPATLAVWQNDTLTQLNVGEVSAPAVRAIRGKAQDVLLDIAAPEA